MFMFGDLLRSQLIFTIQGVKIFVILLVTEKSRLRETEALTQLYPANRRPGWYQIA